MPSSLSLYSIESSLAALLDSEGTVTPEQELEYANDLIVSLKNAVEKRDRVAQYMAHLLNQADLAAGECLRLKKREVKFRTAATKLGEYVLNVIREIGPDAKGKWKRLEGQTATFVPKKCPVSVEIIDESIVPEKYRRVTVTMAVPTWQRLLERSGVSALEISQESGASTMAVSKSAIRKALDAGDKVPGASLVTDKLRLEVE